MFSIFNLGFSPCHLSQLSSLPPSLYVQSPCLSAHITQRLVGIVKLLAIILRLADYIGLSNIITFQIFN